MGNLSKGVANTLSPVKKFTKNVDFSKRIKVTKIKEPRNTFQKEKNTKLIYTLDLLFNVVVAV